MNSSHDIHDIGSPQHRTKVRDLVRERYEVRRRAFEVVLDEFGSTRVGTDAGSRGKRPGQFFESVEGPFVVPAQHNAVGEHEVVHGFAFGEEFRVHAYTKIHPGPFAGSGFKSGNHVQVGGPGGTVLLTTTT